MVLDENSWARRRRAPSAADFPGHALRLVLIFLIVVLPPGRVAAESLPAAVSACRAESDAAQRLRCYDAEVDRIEAAAGGQRPAVRESPPLKQGASLQPAVAAPAPTASAQTAAPSPRAGTTLPMFRAKIVAMSFRRAGEFVITLDNGQVWTQYVTEGKARIGVGDTVLIRPGFMGAYILKGPTDWITKVHLLGSDPDS